MKKNTETSEKSRRPIEEENTEQSQGEVKKTDRRRKKKKKKLNKSSEKSKVIDRTGLNGYRYFYLHITYVKSCLIVLTVYGNKQIKKKKKLLSNFEKFDNLCIHG
jgi:hypothetical protein